MSSKCPRKIFSRTFFEDVEDSGNPDIYIYIYVLLEEPTILNEFKGIKIFKGFIKD